MAIMNIHHVVLVFVCSMCVCLCDINSTVNVRASHMTQNPGDCNLSNCSNCTKVFFSERDSMCFYLSCDSDESCDDYIAHLGGKTHDGVDSLQLPTPLQKKNPSQSPPALPATQTAPASPLTPPVPVPDPDGKQHSANSSTSQDIHQAHVLNNTHQNGHLGQIINHTTKDGEQDLILKSSTSDGEQGQVTTNPTRDGNNTTRGAFQGLVLNITLNNGTLGQVLNNSLLNGQQVQQTVKFSTPAPTSPPVPVTSVGAENISSTISKGENGTRVNKTGQETTTTTTAASTSAVNYPTTTVNVTTTTNTTPTTTTTTSATTSIFTSPPFTTTVHPPPTPTPTPSPSPPPFLSSVPPSTPLPGQNPAPTTPKVPDVTSNQDKVIAGTSGGKFTSHFLNISSLIAVLIFGLLFFIVTIILFLRHAYESYKRRGYTQMDYLINGMYSDSGL